MRVRFFAYLRDLTGCAEADVPYQKTAGALARSLCTRYGEKFREKVFPEDSPEAPGPNRKKNTEAGKFGPEIIVLINGRHVNHLGGVAAPLKPEDRVDIFPVVAGG